MEGAILHIFHEDRGEVLVNRYMEKLNIRFQNIESAQQIRDIFDQVLFEIAEELGRCRASNWIPKYARNRNDEGMCLLSSRPESSGKARSAISLINGRAYAAGIKVRRKC